MSNIDKQALRADAMEATGGSWVMESGEGWEAICCDDDQGNAGFIIAEFHGENATANRKFVQSANPATVMALLDELEAAEKRNAELESLTAPRLPQPVPVSVPAEMPEPDTARMFFTDAVVAIAKVQGWNACRAAMLQGAKQWIPCSERMPEEEQGSVIGWNAETCEVGEYFYDNDEVDCFSYYNFCGYHSFNADVVTHWMPLPSAPQKEVR